VSQDDRRIAYGSQDHDFDVESSNTTSNPHFADVLVANQRRRALLKGVLGVAVAGALGMRFGNAGAASSNYLRDYRRELDQAGIPYPLPPRPGFLPVPPTRADAITLPPGYRAQVLLAWGEPLTGTRPAYREGGLNTGAEQEQQVGQHHDGMHYFLMPDDPNNHGLLVFNHEYIDPATLHPNGPTTVGGVRPADEVRKEIAAHGVTVAEIRRTNGEWRAVPGRYNRRITAATPMTISGPAAGHAKMRTQYSPDGRSSRGTINNCAHGFTPWGTFLTCEENWAGYFVNKDASRPREHLRYGVPSTATRYAWETQDPRFDATSVASAATGDFRNEPNQFGWVVEIDPFKPGSTPKKRTALGRFGHEGAWVSPPRINERVVVYMGDDANNEYVYKFVTRRPWISLQFDRDILDEGTLYVARFNEDGSGTWLPLDFADPAFRAAADTAGVVFADQGDVLINTRLAADVVGATKMDRPEWAAVNPLTREVYITLTNNTARTAAQVDAANPRGPNAFGHIVRWREQDDQPWATTFQWELFELAGDAASGSALPGTAAIPLDVDSMHASPDGLWCDPAGLLWIQTDMSGSQQGTGPFGENQMLAANVETGEIRRFLVGPIGQEVTGVVATPDLRTLFVNIQHPGDGRTSNWPDGGSARPRSACVVITRDDGGIIGT
jgi:uncharacterized protein